MFIVFDLDDTLADTTHRQRILGDESYPSKAKMWDAFFSECYKDEPIKPMLDLLSTLAITRHRHRVEIWTGRSDRVKDITIEWLITYTPLNHNTIHLIPIRMRPDGDFREDTEIKGDWIKEYGKPDIVFEDRNKMAKWWRAQGVTCCQVKENDF